MFIKLEVILISISQIDCLPAPLYPHLLYTPHSIWFCTFFHCSWLTNPYVFLYCFISYIYLYLPYLAIFVDFLCMSKFTIQLVIFIFLFKCQMRAFLLVFKLFFPDFYILRKQKTLRCSNVFRRFKNATLGADWKQVKTSEDWKLVRALLWFGQNNSIMWYVVFLLSFILSVLTFKRVKRQKLILIWFWLIALGW